MVKVRRSVRELIPAEPNRQTGGAVRSDENDPAKLNKVSSEAVHFALRKIVEKEIDRSDATVPADDKIGSRVGWWLAGSAGYPIERVPHHLIPREGRGADIRNLDALPL